MMRLARALALACAFAASAASAQDLTGKWTATAVSNNVAVTLDLKVAGNVVTGAILNPQSGAAEIRDGKIEGAEIRFTRSVEGAAGPGMEIIAKRAQ